MFSKNVETLVVSSKWVRKIKKAKALNWWNSSALSKALNAFLFT